MKLSSKPWSWWLQTPVYAARKIRERVQPQPYQQENARWHWTRAALSALPDGARLLDAGAGELFFKPACVHLDYVSQDFAQYDGTGDAGLQMGTWDQSQLDIVCDIVEIPQPDASFDAILCAEVFEHLPDPLAALRELSRLAKPGGELILTSPFNSLVHFAPHHYATGFSRYWYEKHLPANGFEIIEMTPNGNFFTHLAQEIHRAPSIANIYGQHKISTFEHLAFWLSVRAMNRLSKAAPQSSELQAHGFWVRARRV